MGKVGKVNKSSPLRYPGGKAAMSGLLAELRRINGLGDRPIAEPFAGGAGASLNLLFNEEAPEIYINDADPAIHDFWWSVVRHSDDFTKLLSRTRVSMAEWRRQRAVYSGGGRHSRLRRGFSAFFLNRCNRSGIISGGGPIGGVQQTGEWKIDARYNKEKLIQRCLRIAEYRERIHTSDLDGVDFIQTVSEAGIAPFLFIDPPYYVKGPTLYLNKLTHDYHASLARVLHEIEHLPWVVTYDDCPEIRALYADWATIRPFTLRYNAAERRQGREVLIAPEWMQLPTTQLSNAIRW